MTQNIENIHDIWPDYHSKTWYYW